MGQIVLISLLPLDVAAWLHIYSMDKQPGATQFPLNLFPTGVADFESQKTENKKPKSTFLSNKISFYLSTVT